MSEKAFSQKLENHRFVKGKHPRTRRVWFRGIKLRPKEEDCFGATKPSSSEERFQTNSLTKNQRLT
jgi:hypothetical protein